MFILQDFSSKYQSLLTNWNTNFICNFLFEQRNRHLKRFWRPVWGLYTKLLIFTSIGLKKHKNDRIGYYSLHFCSLENCRFGNPESWYWAEQLNLNTLLKYFQYWSLHWSTDPPCVGSAAKCWTKEFDRTNPDKKDTKVAATQHNADEGHINHPKSERDSLTHQ